MGYKSQDQIYLDDEKAVGVAAIDFILATASNVLDPDSGVIGFARDYASVSSTILPTTTFLT